MLAIVAPGQGSQKPGMLIPWLENPAHDAALAAYSESVGLDLKYLGTEATADEIKDTSVTQPLVVASALLAASALDIPAGTVIAGHSVGELAAAAIAGVFPDEVAVTLAGIRGAEMAKACALTPTSMAAVLGGDAEIVASRLAELDLVGANVNGGGQVVAAGSLTGIEELLATPPAGARAMPLSVAGAFHTAYMAPAREALAEHAARRQPADPTRTLLTNSDGSVVESGQTYLDLLVSQVTSPVRWDLCMATFKAMGVTGVLELPPAGALVGLVKRELKGVGGEKGTATFALKSPEDLDAAAAFIAEHSGA
ncbi:ACP S-malonyltransferase [Nakamurella silvestris]|nr:ACP S-malonyltransferase [Nakamurella silvestris]